MAVTWFDGRWARGLVIGSGTALLGSWLLFVAGSAPPLWLSRVLVLAGVTGGLLELGAGLARAWRQARNGDLSALAVPAIVVLALVLALWGLDHEINDRTWLDEGTYAHHASEINTGHWVRDSFVYPHLLYYAGAFAIWLASLAAEPGLAAARACTEVDDWATLCRLVLRLLVAVSGALAVIPTARLARRLTAPSLAASAGLAGLALALSTPWIEGSHLAICDIPSAVLAVCCLASCARWLDDSRPRVWLVAGLCSGLAAAAKYPAGLVAGAILALAIRDGLARPKRGLLALVTAATASLGAFLLTNPSLLVVPEMAWSGDRGILFGVIQYAGSGWLGVVPEHPLAWYAGIARQGFGVLGLVLGLAGLLLVDRRTRRRLGWLAPFPLVFVLMLSHMTVAVERNLYPLLPALAVLVGIGLAASAERLTRACRSTGEEASNRSHSSTPLGRGAALGLVSLVLVGPAWASLNQAIGYQRPNTREMARQWITRELTPGLLVLRDDYAPTLPPELFDAARVRGRFAGILGPAELERRGIDLVVLAEPSWGRFLGSPDLNVSDLDPADQQIRRNYESLFAKLEPLARFEAGPRQRGPRIDVLLAPRRSTEAGAGGVFGAEAFFVADGTMREETSIMFRQAGQWASLTLPLPAGGWQLVPSTSTGAHTTVTIWDRRGTTLAAATPATASLTLAHEQVVVVRVEAEPGTSLAGIEIAPSAEGP